MAAKGSVAKSEIMQKLVEVFDDAFIYNNGKEVRINMKEAGEDVQIKVTLTAAKVAVVPEGKSPIPASKKTSQSIEKEEFIDFTKSKVEDSVVLSRENKELVQPTDEEKANLKTMLQNLGLV